MAFLDYNHKYDTRYLETTSSIDEFQRMYCSSPEFQKTDKSDFMHYRLGIKSLQYSVEEYMEPYDLPLSSWEHHRSTYNVQKRPLVTVTMPCEQFEHLIDLSRALEETPWRVGARIPTDQKPSLGSLLHEIKYNVIKMAEDKNFKDELIKLIQKDKGIATAFDEICQTALFIDNIDLKQKYNMGDTDGSKDSN